MGVTPGGIALSGPDLMVLLRTLRLRIAVTVLRLSAAAAFAAADASLAVTGCNVDLTETSPGPSDGSLVCILVLPAMYIPGAGRRDKLLLRRTEDGCSCAAEDDSTVEELLKAEAVTAILLLPSVSDGSVSPEHIRSDVPT